MSFIFIGCDWGGSTQMLSFQVSYIWDAGVLQMDSSTKQRHQVQRWWCFICLFATWSHCWRPALYIDTEKVKLRAIQPFILWLKADIIAMFHIMFIEKPHRVVLFHIGATFASSVTSLLDILIISLKLPNLLLLAIDYLISNFRCLISCFRSPVYSLLCKSMNYLLFLLTKVIHFGTDYTFHESKLFHSLLMFFYSLLPL